MDYLLKTYPDSGLRLQITQPNWKPVTPIQEVYLQHVRACNTKFDMTNYNNHNYWMRVAPRRPQMNSSFTRLNDGVLPPGPKLLMLATFALPVTFVVDIHPFLRGWIKRLHNMFHGGMYQRVVDVPKWSFYNTATVNRMGVTWVISRFFCRIFQLTREQSYFVCSWMCIYITLPRFYRMARIGLPTAYCLFSYCTYKILQHYGHINVLGQRRGRRSRELFALKTTRTRVRAAEERFASGTPAPLFFKFFKYHSKSRDKRFRFHRFRKRRRRRSTRKFWAPYNTYHENRFNAMPTWYYGKFGNKPKKNWDESRPDRRDLNWQEMENLRNDYHINLIHPERYDYKMRQRESVEMLNRYLDDRFWVNPNRPIHGQRAHSFERYLDAGDNYFF